PSILLLLSFPTRRSSDLHLAQIRLLQKLEHFQIVALDVEVFGGVPVAAVCLDRAQGLGGGAGSLGNGLLFAHPGKLVPLIALYHDRKSTRLNSSHVSI